MAATTYAVHDDLVDVEGTPQAKVRVTVGLYGQGASDATIVTEDGVTIVKPVTVVSSSSGHWDAEIYSSTEVTPSGLVYLARAHLHDGSHRDLYFTGTSTGSIGAQLTMPPASPIPAGATVYTDAALARALNGSTITVASTAPADPNVNDVWIVVP